MREEGRLLDRTKERLEGQNQKKIKFQFKEYYFGGLSCNLEIELKVELFCILHKVCVRVLFLSVPELSSFP